MRQCTIISRFNSYLIEFIDKNGRLIIYYPCLNTYCPDIELNLGTVLFFSVIISLLWEK